VGRRPTSGPAAEAARLLPARAPAAASRPGPAALALRAQRARQRDDALRPRRPRGDRTPASTAAWTPVTPARSTSRRRARAHAPIPSPFSLSSFSSRRTRAGAPLSTRSPPLPSCPPPRSDAGELPPLDCPCVTLRHLPLSSGRASVLLPRLW
jgi:hypothetical protein